MAIRKEQPHIADVLNPIPALVARIDASDKETDARYRAIEEHLYSMAGDHQRLTHRLADLEHEVRYLQDRLNDLRQGKLE